LFPTQVRLRAKTEKISQDIKNLDEEYQSNLSALRKSYEDGDKETEERYNAIKENAQLVDDIRTEIRKLESDKRSVKLTINLLHKKTSEIEAILISTFQPLQNYLEDSQRVASRVKAAVSKKEDYDDIKNNLNQAVLDVFTEVAIDYLRTTSSQVICRPSKPRPKKSRRTSERRCSPGSSRRWQPSRETLSKMLMSKRLYWS
jgi:chromosome segregation ATPase